MPTGNHVGDSTEKTTESQDTIRRRSPETSATHSVEHRCFRILEVLRTIMEHARADELYGARTLIALSVTCRMFHDVAQDVLWRHQSGLAPLLMCMPQAVWDHEVMLDANLFCFVRPPLPPEWTRFQINAARVRSLSYSESASDIDEDVWGMIALYRPPVSRLLPRLRKLEWLDSSDAFAFVNMFLGPSITELTLGRKYGDRSFASVLSAVPYLCSQLEKLRLTDLIEWLVLTNDVALPLFEKMEKARIYDAEWVVVPGEALLYLARRPFLKQAKFSTIGSCLPTAEELAQGPVFPAIRRLHVHLEKLDASSLAFLRAITSTSLRQLALSAADPEKAVLVEHLQALRDRPDAEKLTNLSLTFPRFRGSAPEINRPGNVIDLEALELVLSFPHLLHLNITSAYLQVDDIMVTRVVRTFPQLRTLRLQSNYRTGRVPPVSLDGIHTIAQECKHLRELGIAFDTTTTGTWNIPFQTVWNTTLRKFDVGDSPIVHPGPVSLFLTLLFANPDLQVVADLSGFGDNRALRQQYVNLWREVQQQIGFMAMARQQERTRMEQWFPGPRFECTFTPEPEDSDSEEESSTLL